MCLCRLSCLCHGAWCPQRFTKYVDSSVKGRIYERSNKRRLAFGLPGSIIHLRDTRSRSTVGRVRQYN